MPPETRKRMFSDYRVNQAGYSADPTSGLFLPGGKALDFSNIKQVVSDIAKSSPAEQAEFEKRFDRKLGVLFSSWYSLFASQVGQYGLSGKPRNTVPNKLLREAYKQSLIDQVIISTRLQQIKLVCERVIVPKLQKGWEIKHVREADPYFKPSESDKKRIKEVEFTLEHPWKEVHTDFRDFLIKAVEDQLVVDRKVMPVVRDSTGRPLRWYLLPPDDVLPRYQVLLRYMREKGLNDQFTAAESFYAQYGINLADISYVQLLDDFQISAAWKENEIEVDITSPSNELNMYGWGYCLTHDSRVDTDQGKLLISDIVKNQLPVKVRSFNEQTNTFEWNKVIGWSSKAYNKDICHIYYGGLIKENLRCTNEHPILTDKGWKKAETLTLADSVCLEEKTLSYDQRQIILGSLLGDACISRPWGFPSLQIAHGPKQKYYLDWIASSLSDLGGEVKERKVKGSTGNINQAFAWASQSLACLYDIHKVVIAPDGIKRPNKAWLDQIDVLGLAIWVMDNGSFHNELGRKNKDGGKRKQLLGAKFTFHTNGFTLDEIQLIIDWLKYRWDLDARLSCPPSLKGTGEIALSSKASYKLYELIKDYLTIHATNEKYGCGKLWRCTEIDQTKPSLLTLPITKIVKKPISKGQKVYDLCVENAHNFTVQNVIVHNSMFERSIEATSILIYSLRYQKEFFLKNIPDQMLIINGEVDPAGLQYFKEQLFANAGPQSNQRLPILPTNDENYKVQLLRLSDTNVDMQMISLVRFFVALKCAAYRIHPSTINLSPDLGDRGTSIIASAQDEADVIGSLAEEGFKGLLTDLSHFINRALVKPWYDDLSFGFSVEDIPPPKDRIALWTQKISIGATMDEFRASEGLPPLEEVTDGKYSGKLPGSPFVFQAKELDMQQEAMEQQAATEDERGDMAGFTGGISARGKRKDKAGDGGEAKAKPKSASAKKPTPKKSVKKALVFLTNLRK